MFKGIIAALGAFAPKLAMVTNFPLFKWYVNLLLTMDFMTNAILLGDPRETISSVLGKMRRDGTCKLCMLFCGLLSIIFMEKEHCKNAIIEGLGRGTDNDMSPMPGLRRKWSNGFVVILLAMFWYKDEILGLIANIT